MSYSPTSRFPGETARFMPGAFAAVAPADEAVAEEGRPQTVKMVKDACRLSAEQLCSHYGNENAHTEHVTRLALQLFEATHRWLGLARDDRALLEAAGRVHDVAYRVDPVHHPERGADIIWNEGLKGYSAGARACIAAVVFLHSGKCKEKLDHPILKRLRHPRQALRLGALLRIADGLDWGHVQDAEILGVKKARQSVRVSVRSDAFPPNVVRADRKADLWRRVIPLDVKLELVKSRHPPAFVERGAHPLEVARRLLSVQYKTILANVDGAVAGEDPEHLHRIRVAIRRLRGLLRVFRKSLPDTAALDETLRLLGDVLGPARDLDVWVAFLHSDDVADVLKGNRRWPAFVQHHEQVRRLHQPTVRRELLGGRFMALRRRMAKLLHIQLPPLVQAGRPVTLEEMVVKRLLKEMGRVRDLAAQRNKQAPEKLHRLRVALRRARYVGEFFGPVLGKDAGKLARRLHQVEKPLAQIHDLEVGLSLVQNSGPLAPRAFSELLHNRDEEQRKLVEPAWQRYVASEKKALREMQTKPE